jgi:hypothetical protein
MNCNSFPSAPIVNIGTPTACECDTAAGGNVSTGPTTTPQNYQFPTTTTSAIIPAGNALFSVQSPGAPLWAATGMLVWFPELEGYASIRSVIGDAITLKALTIPAGSTVQVGSRMVPAPPTQSESGSPNIAAQLTSIQGLNDGLPGLLQGSLGDMLFHNGSGFGKVKASPFVPLPTRPLVLTVKRDVVAVTTNLSTRWENPIWGGNAKPAPDFITFPSLPVLAVGQQPRALVEVRWEMATRTSSPVHGTIGVTVNFGGGFSWIKRQFCQAIATGPTSSNNAAFVGEIAAKSQFGIDTIMIPVPVDGSPPAVTELPITVTARRSTNTTGDANSHYIIEFRVLGYFV